MERYKQIFDRLNVDESFGFVRKDNNMEKAKVINGFLQYRKVFRMIEVPVEDIVWGYLQIEAVKASMCCGGFHTEIGRAIFMEKSGERHIIQYEGTEKAKELLDKVKDVNSNMEVGFTKENKQKFLNYSDL